MLSEYFGESFQNKVDTLDPESDVHEQFARNIIMFISNNQAGFYDTSIVKTDEKGLETNFGLYDKNKEEYRLHNGKYFFIVPRTVIAGEETIVKRRKFVANSVLDRFISLSAQLSWDVLDNIQKLTLYSPNKFEWGTRNIISLNKDLLEKLRK